MVDIGVVPAINVVIVPICDYRLPKHACVVLVRPNLAPRGRISFGQHQGCKTWHFDPAELQCARSLGQDCVRPGNNCGNTRLRLADASTSRNLSLTTPSLRKKLYSSMFSFPAASSIFEHIWKENSSLWRSNKPRQVNLDKA